MKILFLSNIPSPYRVEFFNLLGENCELTVLFEKSSSDERVDNWNKSAFKNFEGIVLKGKSIATDSAFCPSVVSHLKKNVYDHIIVSNFTNFTGMLAIEYMRMKKIPYILESDGGFAKDLRGLKEKLKLHIIKDASAYFSTATPHDNYYLTYGAKKNKLVRYPFTSIYNSDILPEISKAQKLKSKDSLGIAEEKMILNIGQIIHRKGIDVLLKACENMPSDVGVYIVGGNPTAELNEIISAHKLKNIHFIPFQEKAVIKEYMKAADVFAFPTREDIWGLVVNEAMSQGLPVITTDNCVAGLQMVKDGENGYIIPVNDSVALREKIDLLLNDNALREKLSNGALKTAKEYTFEKMVDAHLTYFAKEK